MWDRFLEAALLSSRATQAQKGPALTALPIASSHGSRAAKGPRDEEGA